MKTLKMISSWPWLFAGVLLLPSVCHGAEVKQMSQGQFMFQTFLYVFTGLGLYYFVVTRPAVQREERQKSFLANLKKNDEVLVGDAIYGRVVSIAEDAVTVEIAPNVRIRVRSQQLSKGANVAGVKELNAAKG